jgi:hypothetical protein
MKKVKVVFRAILSFLLLGVVYILFIADRIVLAITSRYLSNFATWGELHLPESKREYKAIKRSFKRVITILCLLFFLLWMTSCVRKDYMCDCVYQNPVHGPQEESFVIEANNKKSAAEHCENGGGVFFVDFECELR